MVAILSVAEKPSVAKELTAIISRCNPDALRRAGFSPYNHIYDIPQCSFRDAPASMRMTSVLGHVMEVEFDAKYRSWRGCSPVELFSAPIHKTVKTENEPLRRTLTNEAKNANVLLLWLDCDLEGENIAFEVISICQQANPRLDIYRARFSALIERDILRTLRVPDRPNMHKSQAVDARQEIDLRIGAAFTRFQTMRLQKKFDIGKQVVSYGPCQFPTLGFVVERDLTIKAFVPEQFWSIQCDAELEDTTATTAGKTEIERHGGGGGEDEEEDENHRRTSERGRKNNKRFPCHFTWSRGSVYDHLAALVLYESCFDAQQRVIARVTACQERPTSKHKPLPLNTIEFQILASRQLRISAQEAMEVAESLYQRGILSYPRTETNFFKEGFDLFALITEQRQHSLWGAFAKKLLFPQELPAPLPGQNAASSLFEWPRVGGKDDQAHPPIHPLKSVELHALESERERKVYELVARHFLACCSRDALGNQSTLSIEITPRNARLFEEQHGGGRVAEREGEEEKERDTYAFPGELFTTSGLMVTQRNYLDVYGNYESWGAREKTLPVLQVNETFLVSSFMLNSGQTSAPSPLSESELIALMDRHGIGTDATIAQHINTIQTREYVIRDAQQRFVPTPLGLALVEGYNAMGYRLNKPELRALMEADCQRVAKGELTREYAVQHALTMMQACFESCQREARLLDEAMKKYFPVLGGGGVNNNNNNFAAIGGEETAYETTERELSRCGQCQQWMELRVSRENAQYSRRIAFCRACQRGLPLPSRGILSRHEVTCVLCGFQVLTVKNEETGRDHTICPHCFSNPPNDLENVDEFRCFSCSNETCPLAGSVVGENVDVAPCRAPHCAGHMRVKRNAQKSSYFLACNVKDCKTTWWLPKWVASVTPLADNICTNCEARHGVKVCKLTLKAQGHAPPGVQPVQVVCPVCDSLWSHTDTQPLQLRRPVSQQTTHATHTLHTPHTPHNAMARVSQHMPPPPFHVNAFNAPPPHITHTPYTAPHTPHTPHTSFTPHTTFPTHTPTYTHHNLTTQPPFTTTAECACRCEKPARRQIVGKDGPNKGRPFFACAQSTSCGFFQWADVAPPPASGSASSSRGSVSVSSESAPMCGCGERANIQTTMKDGPNKNRQFYSCAKRLGETGRCDFFQWASANASDSNSFSSSNLICSACKCSGHYARQCPNKR